jgi:hypothetical protein
MILRDNNRGFRRALTTSSAATGFASKIPTTTEPTNDGVVACPSPRGHTPQTLVFIPFGEGTDDGAFDMRIIGWKAVKTLWVPVPLAQVAVVLSTAVGVAGTDVVAADRFADTLTLVAGFSTTQVIVTSPTGNIIAHGKLALEGFPKVEFTFDMGINGTNGNCLVSWL